MASPVTPMDDDVQHEAEIRLLGLILAQSALVGVSIGVFDAEVWLENTTPVLNGLTYAMSAFFVQGIAYYMFKVFFERGMRERANAGQLERDRSYKYRSMQQNFDSRRNEMEMRVQEAQLERELRWMEANPGQMPPSWGVPGGAPSLIGNYDKQQIDASRIPHHSAQNPAPLTLGISDEEVPMKKDGTPDKRYEKKA